MYFKGYKETSTEPRTANSADAQQTDTTSGAEQPTSYVIEAGTATGKNDLGSFIAPGNTTTAERDGVPGNFFLRVYARNACGTSPASNEVAVTLP